MEGRKRKISKRGRVKFKRKEEEHLKSRENKI